MSETPKSQQLQLVGQGSPSSAGYCPQWLYDEVFLALHHLFRLQLIDRPKTPDELKDTIEGFAVQIAANRRWSEAEDLDGIRRAFAALGDNTWWPAPSHFLAEASKWVAPQRSSGDHEQGERMGLTGLAKDIRDTLDRLPDGKTRMRFLTQFFYAPKQAGAPLRGPNVITAGKVVEGWNDMLDKVTP